MQRRLRQMAAGATSVAVGAALVSAIRSRPEPSVSLPTLVRDSLERSGVSHEITAVLLNFRSYDTLLEIAVLLAAAVVALALRDEPNADEQGARKPAHVQYIALDSFVWRLAPLLVLVAAYLLWIGSKQPGGAFQAGAMLAGAAVLLRLSGINILPVDHRISSRIAMTFGLAIFLCVAIATLLAGGSLLEYPAEWAGTLILVIEAALTISIGVVLYSLFDNAPSARAPKPGESPLQHDTNSGAHS